MDQKDAPAANYTRCRGPLNGIVGHHLYAVNLDTKTVDASKVCVFEANGRVGGRIYSVRGLPGFADA